MKFGIAAAILLSVIFTSMPDFSLLIPGKAGNGNNTENSQNFDGKSEDGTLRIGYFPNINHAQAVIGMGRGDFQRALGDIKVTSQIFNAGPSAIEAIFANQIDLAYVGPNPAINGYIKTDGEVLRIIAGATSGGVVFVVRNDSGIIDEGDFAGKKFASPQLGNTQDVALRKFLQEKGYKTRENGGNVEIIPAKNSDILTLLLKKDIDGAWIPEPWGAKFLKETNSKIFLDERTLWPNGQFITAHIIVRNDYLKNNPETIKKFLAVHVNETLWIKDNQDDAMRIFNDELKKLTGKTIPEDEIKESLARMEFTYDPIKESLVEVARDAYDIGFLKTEPDLQGIYELDILNKVLSERGLKQVN